MARPGKCARCGKHRINQLLGEQICKHCKLISLHYVFGLQPDSVRLDESLAATKKWHGGISTSSVYEVIYSRMSRGEKPDEWFVAMHRILEMPMPERRSARGHTISYLQKKTDMPADTERLLANAKRRARTWAQKIQAKDQCPELTD